MLLSLLPFATAVHFLKANFQEVVFIHATARPGVNLCRNVCSIFCGGEQAEMTAVAIGEALFFRLFSFCLFFLMGIIF